MGLLARRQRVAGLGFIELGEGDGLADGGRSALLAGLADELEDAGDAAGLVVAGQEGGAVAGLAGEHARDRHLAAMGGVQRLEHIGDGIGARLDAEALRRVGDARRFMAQRLQQPQDAVGARRGAHQHRADEPFAQFAREVVEHLVARRLDVLEQLLHQLVVMVGERLQHGEARRLLAVGGVAFERNDFRGSVLLVDEGAFQREIDEAGDEIAGERRDLSQDQLGARAPLQQLEHVVDAGVGLVDLVEEQNARNFPVFQLAQNELQLRYFLLVHFAHDHRRVDRRQHRAHVVDELDRAGAIEEGVGVAHEIGGGDRELDAHAMMARFLAAVADRVAGLDGALALDHAGAGEDRFEQRGLAALEGTDQRDTAGTGRARRVVSVCCHDCLPAQIRRSGRGSHDTIVSGGGGAGQGRMIARPRGSHYPGCVVERGRAGRSPRPDAAPTAPMPAAISSPTCPCTDNGCSATVRFDPPTSTLAPRPAATDTSAVAPV